jgi:hypothetical protein
MLADRASAGQTSDQPWQLSPISHCPLSSDTSASAADTIVGRNGTRQIVLRQHVAELFGDGQLGSASREGVRR